MREVVLDLTDIGEAMPETFADSPAKAQMDNILLDYTGKIIRVRVTEVRKRKRRASHD
ncbi:hypothetical protein LCGC14_1949330 [marine sediment metagenome]|uniref:Uncharacterized protein n=1 Tax=marine sediment metagenome TaxID=412755 RepID=A0A0F9FHU6_9ZZZZ